MLTHLRLAQKTKGLLVVRKSESLLEAIRATSDADTKRIVSNAQLSDHWASVQLSESDVDPKWFESAFENDETVPDSFRSEYLYDPTALNETRRIPHRNPPLVPLVPLVPRPFIDIRHSDVRRWQLAMAYPDFANLPPNLFINRIRNIPRFADYETYTPLYIGFGLVSLIYGGLHCLAWDAPFTSPAEAVLWRLSSVCRGHQWSIRAVPVDMAKVPPILEPHRSFHDRKRLGLLG